MTEGTPIQPPAPAARTLNLIVWDNGVGLSRDLRLLAAALREAGFEVHLSPIGRGKLRKWLRPLWMRAKLFSRRLRGGALRFDANIMLEHIRPEDMPAAARNFFIPNPEWCLPSDVALLDKVDAVLAKTHHARDIFAARDCRVAEIGFTSEDRYDPSIPRARTFFHLAGRSRNKGTQRLIALWRRHPEWPLLTVVQSPREAVPIEPAAANIVHRVDYIDDAELRMLQNGNWFHICSSETEGFGHYLVEAMSVGAVASTTDAPPMSELVQPDRGILVPYERMDTQFLANTYFFDEAAAEAAIERMIVMPDDELERMGANARAWFLRNDSGFSERLRRALTPLID